jgi:CheY-like chemotaxis protein
VAIRVVIAEDNLLVREGVERLLGLQPDIQVVVSCEDLGSLLAAVEAARPDVVLTDIRMPPDHGDEGIQAALRLRETHPALGVVVLSQYAEPAYALALLEGGSERRAYLLKDRVDSDQPRSAQHGTTNGTHGVVVVGFGCHEASPLSPRQCGQAARDRAERCRRTRSTRLTAPGSRRMRVCFSEKARRGLAPARSVGLALRAVITDAAGNRRTLSRRVTLRR